MVVLANPLWQQRVWRWLAREGPFLAQQSILVRDCRSFAGLDDRWLRIAVGKRRHNRKLVAAMAAGLKHLDRHPSATPEKPPS